MPLFLFWALTKVKTAGVLSTYQDMFCNRRCSATFGVSVGVYIDMKVVRILVPNNQVWSYLCRERGVAGLLGHTGSLYYLLLLLSHHCPARPVKRS